MARQQQQQSQQYQRANFPDNRQKSHFQQQQEEQPQVQQFNSKKQGQQPQVQQFNNKQQNNHGQKPQRQSDPRFYIRVSSFPFTEYNVVLWFPDSALFDGWGHPYMSARRDENFGGYIYWPADGSVPQIIEIGEERFDDFQAQVQYTLDLLALGLNKSSTTRPSAANRVRTVYRSDWRLKAITALSFVACIYLLFFKG